MSERRDEPSTEELHAGQRQREGEERELLDQSQTPDEAQQHERRAEKHSYLKRKLEERAESERRAAEEQ